MSEMIPRKQSYKILHPFVTNNVYWYEDSDIRIPNIIGSKCA